MTIVIERFLLWARTAPVARRTEAAAALARAYLHSPLEPDQRDGIEAAMTVLLDDSAAEVRVALAEELCTSDDAPIMSSFCSPATGRPSRGSSWNILP
jgi:uncharacterized protein (DUF2336 family)